MKFGGQGPGNLGQMGPGFPGQLPGGQQGQPGVGPGTMGPGPYGPGQIGPGPSPGGSIRNTLGSGLKSMGVFQKDGQINNLRGGFIGPKQPTGGFPGEFPSGYSQQGFQGYGQGAVPGAGVWGENQGTGGGTGPFSFLSKGPGASFTQPRQLILQSAHPGITGNGIATISPDNTFLLVANLPPPANLFSGQGISSYAAYLVDKKGKTGFLAGVLRPVGNGVYQTQFKSPVPLHPYERVVVSVESNGRLAQAPNGPIILKVPEPKGPSAVINPIKNTGGAIWKKVMGLFQRSPEAAPVPEGALAGAAGSVLGAEAGQVLAAPPIDAALPPAPPIPPSPK
ncbi:hypothetical protein [Paradesulfitobacterium ferrireducens]|uniref:hypothetical protein n=1 Tax=Paradesulfitobacterium ferrireducens TaxID=2816476 RepID=UPI002E29D960|nr:hypothetical protein [Paradesulfitobacterium ferrireducens]